MKQDTLTTREKAIEWWNKHISLGKTKLCDTHAEIVGNIRRWETLTENEIEAIYLSENPEQPDKEQSSNREKELQDENKRLKERIEVLESVLNECYGYFSAPNFTDRYETAARIKEALNNK